MQRNITLDYFKIILSILVITIHIPYPFNWDSDNWWYWYIPNGLARMAVPIFFIINGYYFARKINDPKAIKKYLIHLLIIYTTWFIIYLRPFIYQTNQFSIFNDFKLDIILETYVLGYFHLWYLPALIEGILILVFLKKVIKNDAVITIIGISLYITGYILEPGKSSLYSVRNALFFGFPFISLGSYLYKADISKIKSKYIILTSITAFIILFTESTFAYKHSQVREIYLSLLFLCPSLFLIMQKYATTNNRLRLSPNYSGYLSSAIYFSHVYVVFKSFTLFDVSALNRFLIVLLITLPISIFIIFVNKRIKIFL